MITPMVPAAAAAAIVIILLPICVPSPALAFIPSHLSRPSLPLAATTTSATPTPASPLKSPPGDIETTRLILEHVDQIISSNPILINGDASSSLDSTTILRNINQDHERDVRWAQASALPFESEIDGKDNRMDNRRNTIEYEPIQDAAHNPAIAIRTKLSTPLLNNDEIQLLHRASESYWNRPLEGGGATSEKSRFTYQRKGNSEAHLSDVVKHTQQSNSGDVTSLVNELFFDRIYPWVREAYLSKEKDGDELELYVYDSLLIRYNATEANMDNDNVGNDNPRSVGAGQPLHRDLGFVSVNIMLNPSEEFEGGGTFFENQLLPIVQPGNNRDGSEPSSNIAKEMHPLKPLGPGGALAHFSSDRHAGAATYAGVRDILVIFLAAREKTTQQSMDMKKAPRWESSSRIKSTARTYCSGCCSNSTHDQLVCRILHHRLAIDQVPQDGEAWHYLGMALFDYHDHLQLPVNSAADIIQHEGSGSNLMQCGHVLELAVSCLDEAINHTPCDGRLHNNIGISLERLLGFYNDHANSVEIHDKIASAYHNSIMIHSTCEEMRCDVAADYESACLNYGLYLSKLDKFDDAIEILSRIASPTAPTDEVNEMDAATWARQRVIRDATNLLSFCEQQRDTSVSLD
ncbi:hypothetical protein ACHAXR_011750 [Thalassiosira sp. AJA248-18]